MFSFFKKPEEEIVAVFDIGNGSVGGALVKLNVHGLPIMLYSHREPITFVPRHSASSLLDSMLKLLKLVADKITKDGLENIKRSPFGFYKLRDAYCVFSSPWYISQTKVIREGWEKQRTISQGAINDFVKKEQEQFNADLKNGKYEQVFGSNNILLEKRIINISLNGYTVHDPVGKQARELELTLFTSFISKEIVTSVEQTLRKSFSVRAIHHFSYSLVSWGATQILFPDIHDYFFIDISNETTDISLIVKDVLIEIVSFPMGRSTLLRKAVKDLKVTPDVALSFMVMYFNDTLEPAFKNKVEAVIKPIETDWFDDVIVALEQFQKIYSLPRSTFVTADLDTAKLFLQALSKEFPPELNVPKSRLAATYIGADKVQSQIELLPSVAQDSFLSLENIFLNRIFHV